MVLKSIYQLKGALSVVAMKSTLPRIEKARENLCKEIISDTDSFVPYDTGYLASSATILNDGKNIAYTADYAEYVNNMPETNNFNRSVHTNATSNWFEASLALNRDKWLQNFKTGVGGK